MSDCRFVANCTQMASRIPKIKYFNFVFLNIYNYAWKAPFFTNPVTIYTLFVVKYFLFIAITFTGCNCMLNAPAATASSLCQYVVVNKRM